MLFHKYKLSLVNLLIFLPALFITGCSKLVEVKKPQDSITTAEAFSNESTATSALMQVYNHLSYGEGQLEIFNGLITLNSGLSADELNTASGDQEIQEFQGNSLQSQNSAIIQQDVVSSLSEYFTMLMR